MGSSIICLRCGKGIYYDYGYYVKKCSVCNHMISNEKWKSLWTKQGQNVKHRKGSNSYRLKDIRGGYGVWHKGQAICSNCGSHRTYVKSKYSFECMDCGKKWVKDKGFISYGNKSNQKDKKYWNGIRRKQNLKYAHLQHAKKKYQKKRRK